jgi:hypothetical protein
MAGWLAQTVWIECFGLTFENAVRAGAQRLTILFKSQAHPNSPEVIEDAGTI